MLHVDMKRKINTLRDILVGRIPDPKTQVEQITLAMIYKFMDDMDTEWGGDRSFFVKDEKIDYEKYAWSNIMQPQVSGEERSALYREGVESMARNPHIPQLFRDIFNNAYIPFRDSETINMFLKEINDFKYDNSEDLGNAFEMLLSIMGSQGDAGQFRTPRHIIDMIVEIIDPSKAETILDPACGTAGFLISAYKHILKKNTDKEGKSTLTPDERKALNENISGYDISPDMVRLSSVNMYLHHFPNPNIHNYDTLTSEARWDDNFDVILANPPFMTPKGGINPHNRFRVKARRSEVLFVDYIAEHLNPNGKAGIIVPEGIVFQTSNAYKELRKMLIEDNYLYAVISLPAGVFNPYSGVKTSILLLDRTIAKQAENILFVKIENDGYDLGAQRREIKQNDIPRTIKTILDYKKAVLSGKEIDTEESENDYTILESKAEIFEKDAVLVGERYKTIVHNQNLKWGIRKLGEICDIKSGGTPSRKNEEYWTNGNIPWIGSGLCKDSEISEPSEYITELGFSKSSAKLFKKETTLIALVGATIGKTGYLNIEATTNQNVAGLYPKNLEELSTKYLYFISKSLYSEFLRLGDGKFRMASLSFVKSLEIPLPPLSVQQEIVEEIESYQKIIDGAKQVVDNYKPVIKIDPEWDMVELGEVAKPEYGFTDKAKDSGNARYIRITDINSNGLIKEDDSKYVDCSENNEKYILNENDLIVARTGATFGKTAIFRNQEKSIFASFLIRLNIDAKSIDPYFYWAFSQTEAYWKQANSLVSGGAQPQFNANAIKKIKVPKPPIDIQRSIVKDIEEEQELIKINNRIIEIFEQKIKDKIAEVWGE